MRTIEVANLRDVVDALAGVPGGELVCASVGPLEVVDERAARDAFTALAAPVVLAAAPEWMGEVLPVDVPTPYRCLGPALMGRADTIRALGRTDAKSLADAYLSGADLDLDVGAELFLVRDGTGTDALRVGAHVLATATGTRPPLILGGSVDRLAATGDEVALVLGYEGAIDRSGAARMLAPDIVETPFWTPAMCDAVVRAAEAAGPWASDPDDPVPGSEMPLATLSPVLLARVEAHVEDEIVPRWRAHWPEFAWNGLHDAFVIKYVAAGASRGLPLHHDVAQISGSVRLLDGYAGGELEFPRQRWDNGAVPAGALVAWPSLVTHPHRSRPVIRGVKYGLTIWTRLPE